MLDEIRSDASLLETAERLLLVADVRGLLPTPVRRIVEAAGLTEPPESLLSDDCVDQAPDYLAEKMRGLTGKILALLDRREREVHVRPDISPYGAFKRLHEVGHHIVPWQADLAYADDRFTLSVEANARFELEASQVAAELLFQRTLLENQAASRRLRVRTVLDLADTFGASIHSTFRRYVETHYKSVAGVVLARTPVCTTPPCFQRQEGFCSRAWLTGYHDPRSWPFELETGPFLAVSIQAAVVSTMLDAGTFRDPVQTHIEWPDLNGELHSMQLEVFTNSYNLFAMIRPLRLKLPRL